MKSWLNVRLNRNMTFLLCVMCVRNTIRECLSTIPSLLCFHLCLTKGKNVFWNKCTLPSAVLALYMAQLNNQTPFPAPLQCRKKRQPNWHLKSYSRGPSYPDAKECVSSLRSFTFTTDDERSQIWWTNSHVLYSRKHCQTPRIQSELLCKKLRSRINGKKKKTSNFNAVQCVTLVQLICYLKLLCTSVNIISSI